MDRRSRGLESTVGHPVGPDALRWRAAGCAGGSALLRNALGYLAGAACLVWLFHDVRLGDLGRSVADIQWGWVALAIVFDILGYVCQGWRWELLLRPVARVSPWRAAQAIYAGLFTNEILPMRVGELVRAYPGLALDGHRLFRGGPFDGGGAVPGRRLAGRVHRPDGGVGAAPEIPAQAGDILGAVIVAGTVLFLFLVLRPAGAELPRDQSHRPLAVALSGAGGLVAAAGEPGPRLLADHVGVRLAAVAAGSARRCC